MILYFCNDGQILIQGLFIIYVSVSLRHITQFSFLNYFHYYLLAAWYESKIIT